RRKSIPGPYATRASFIRQSIYWTHQGLPPRMKSLTKEAPMKRHFAAITALILSLPVADAAAQAWPNKPLRAIVPVGAGSSTDIVHRIVLEQLSAQLGQPIVV